MEIRDQDCIVAIKVLQKACKYYKDELHFEVGDREMFFEHQFMGSGIIS